nr:1112_t:CDS:10 [Entrophospora candida]
MKVSVCDRESLSEARNGKSSSKCGGRLTSLHGIHWRVSRGITQQESHINWILTCIDPTPIAFFRHIFPSHRVQATNKYHNLLNLAIRQTGDCELRDKLKRMKEVVDESRMLQDWETWMQEKAAILVRRSIRNTSINLHEEINSLARNKNVQVEHEEEHIDNENNEDDKGDEDDNKENGSDEDNDDEHVSFVTNIFQETVTASAIDKKLADIFKSSTGVGSIMDLRPFSKFSLAIDADLHEKILHQVFDSIDVLITDELHSFLTDFFNSDHGPEGWDIAVESLHVSNTEHEIIGKTKKLLKLTLVHFFKAFSLNALNPLRNLETLEKPYLNRFVHPIIDAALWIFGRTNYIYGEIPLQTEKSHIRADGVGYMNDVTNYPLICGEGARPRASRKKQDEDDIKNAVSMVRLYNNIIIAEANARHRLFADLRIYGLTAYKIEVSLTMLDFRDTYRLFEVDHYSLPRDWSDMPKFVYMYEAIIKWVLCVCLTKAGLIANRKKRCMTRYSEVRITKKLAQLRESEIWLDN